MPRRTVGLRLAAEEVEGWLVSGHHGGSIRALVETPSGEEYWLDLIELELTYVAAAAEPTYDAEGMFSGFEVGK